MGMWKKIRSRFVAAALVGLSIGAANQADAATAPIVISGYLANPASTDSPFEYVQVVATQSINFSTTPMSVVWANNGTATTNGWVAGAALTYKLDITSGSLNKGDVAYVGGSGKLINGSGSTDISSANWLRVINTGTTAGDGLGTANSAGVMGNGGANADGIGLFSGTTLTSTSVPFDAVFYGTAVGSATNAYTLPDNDHYTNAGGLYGSAGNSFFFSDPGSGAFVRLTGTYNPATSTWTTPRTDSQVTLTTTSTLSDIAPAVSVPEPSSLALLPLARLLALRRRRA